MLRLLVPFLLSAAFQSPFYLSPHLSLAAAGAAAGAAAAGAAAPMKVRYS